jgi:hypothetical protein
LALSQGWPAGHPRVADRARRAEPSAAPFQPIFLHGMWRSGSTYVWSRFRANDRSLCFYEPLHDGLSRLTRSRIQRDTADQVLSNHHPALATPYFAEFEPLVAFRGVRGYRRRFAYSRFAPPMSHDDPALEAYVNGLVRHARTRERAAVLGFNRTGLRMGWLGRRFDACNIHIDRDPADIFASYLSQLQAGNHYYFVKWMQIIAGNSDYPLFQAARSLFPARKPLADLFVRPKDYYRGVVDDASIETLYTITFLAWAVTALHALEHSDVVIDIALAERPGYCADLSDAIHAQSGLAVSFEDMHAPTQSSPLLLAHRREIERRVLDWIAAPASDNLFDRAGIRARLYELSPRRAELLAAAL